MAETSITKVNAKSSPKGSMGQKYLAAGVSIAMRFWEDEQPGKEKPASERDYETSAMSSKDGPSCIWAHSLCCWNPETPGWFRAAPAIVIAFSSRSPLWKRQSTRFRSRSR